ncbi:MAG TPA: calcium-binding protein [Kribbella sp.]
MPRLRKSARGLLVLFVPMLVAALSLPSLPVAAATADPDVSATTQGLRQFGTFATGLADTGLFGKPLPYLGITPGSPDGIGLGDLFDRLIVDRIPADATKFADLEDLRTSSNLVLGDGRTGGVTAHTTAPADGSTIETLELQLRVFRTIDAPLTIDRAEPRVSFRLARGVHASLAFDASFTFAYDTVAQSFWLVRNATTPAMTIAAVGEIPPSPTDDGAIGLLKVGVHGSSFQYTAKLVGTFDDPNGDGRLAFTEPTAAGPVAGELATLLPGEVVRTHYDTAQASTARGTITVGASSHPGLVIPVADATITVDDDLTTTADDTAAVSTSGIDDTMAKFQNLTADDLDIAIARLAAAVRAVQQQRSTTPGHGDVDLPWLNGTLSDAVRANETLLAFVTANTDDKGHAKFLTLQDFLDRLNATTVDDRAGLGIGDVHWDDATSRFSFTLSAFDHADTPLDVADATVRFGDTFKAAGLVGANAAKDSPSFTKVIPRYDLSIPVVLDLRPPVRGEACKTYPDTSEPKVNPDGLACPYTLAVHPPGDPATVLARNPVDSLPTPADRILVGTGGELLVANPLIASPVKDVAGTAGFLQAALNGGEVRIQQSTTAPMIQITLKDQGLIRLTTLVTQLSTSPTTLLDYVTQGKASATGMHASVPGTPDFFTGTNDAVSASQADITQPSAAVVEAAGLTDRLKPFLFDPGNPASLRGKIANSLTTLATALDQLPANATNASAELTTPIQVIGQPFARFAQSPELKGALADIVATPPDSLQTLVAALTNRLGKDNVSFTVDGDNLVLHLTDNHDLTGSKSPLGLEFTDGGATQRLTGTGDDGQLPVTGTSTVKIDLVVPLDTSNASTPPTVKVGAGSTVTIKPQVTVDDGRYAATAGALALTLGPSHNATIDAKPTLTLANSADGTVSLADWLKGLTGTLGAGTTSCGNAVCAHLPAAKSDGTALNGSFDTNLAADKSLMGSTGSPPSAPSDIGAAQNATTLPLGTMSAAVDPLAGNLKAGLKTASLDGKIPLVGTDLQEGTKFLDTLQTQLRGALQSLPDTKAGTVGTVKNALNGIQQKVDGATTITPKVMCGTAVCADDNAQATTITGVTLLMDFGQGTADDAKGCDPCAPAPTDKPKFSIGIPALQLSATSPPDARIGWKLHLALSFDKKDGLTLVTGGPDSAGPEFKLGVGVTVPDFDGNIAFVKVHASDADPGAGPEFAGSFSLDLKAPSGDRMTLDQLAAAADPSALFDAKLSGQVNIDWKLEATADSNLPGVFATLGVHWNLGSGSLPTIAFSNVGLDLQPLFDGVLQPIYNNIKKVTGPLKPVVDAINAPIPGLSDVSRLVGGGDFSTLTLMQLYGTFGNNDFNALARILRLAGSGLTFAGSGRVQLGGFTIDSQKALNTVPTPDHIQDLAIGNLADAQDKIRQVCSACGKQLDDLRALAVDNGSYGFHLPIIENPKSMIGLLLGQDIPLASYDSGPFTKGFAFSIPIGPIPIGPIPVLIQIGAGGSVSLRFRAGFDTAGIRKALQAGEQAPRFADGFYLQDWDDNGTEQPEITIAGGPFVKAGVTLGVISAGVGADIKLTVSLDLHDTDSPGKSDQAGAGNGDGKVRLAEIGRDAAGNFDVGCLFDANGEIAADVFAFFSIDVPLVGGTWAFNLLKATLLDLGHSCKPRPDPVLATLRSNGDLIVHAGAFGKESFRGGGWGNDRDPQKGADESVTVRVLRDAAGNPTGAGVDLLRYHHDFPGAKRVIVDARGYGGAETVNLLGDGSGVEPGQKAAVHQFDLPAVVLGGNGDDKIKVDAKAGVPVIADGGPGADSITTGGGDDLVSGGASQDTITTLTGNDRVWGDAPLQINATYAATPPTSHDDNDSGDGRDAIDVGPGTDIANGNGNDDTIGGGPGENTLVGGLGGDHIAGGPDKDTVYGDEQVNLGADDAGDVKGGPDTIETGAGEDTVYAGNGNDNVAGHSAKGVTHDHLYGNGGADELSGGDGDDFVYGGPGDDGFTDASGLHAVRGGGGDDWVYGGDGNDIVLGDRDAPGSTIGQRAASSEPGSPADGNDHVYGGHGSDSVYGAGGDDTVYGDAGAANCAVPKSDQARSTAPAEDSDTLDGSDRVVGGSGTDTISGEGAGDVLEGGTGDDLLCGHGGADVISGQDGTDTTFGGSGADQVYGDYGDDHLYGNAGADVLHGGPGDDVAEGNTDDDQLYGDAGDDHLEGNAGADRMYGMSGQDDIAGGTTPDAVAGAPTSSSDDIGDPVLSGGDGADVILGDNGSIVRTGTTSTADGHAERVVGLLDADTIGGADHLYGDDGNDALYAGLGADAAEGGFGDDHIEGNGGPDILSGLAPDAASTSVDQDDMIGGSSTVHPSDLKPDDGDIMQGNGGQDVMIGDNGAIDRPTDDAGQWRTDTDTGGVLRAVTLFDRTRTGSALAQVSGPDRMYGNDASDRIFGQGGDDVLKGNAADDFVQGNQGSDLIEGNAGEDDLIGGSTLESAPGVGDPDGADFVYGGDGADVVLGDNGIITRVPPEPATPGDYRTLQLGITHQRSLRLLDKEAAPAPANYGGDQVSGGSGVDVLFGQDGTDYISGGSGDDYMEGNGAGDYEWGDTLLSAVTPSVQLPQGVPVMPTSLAGARSPAEDLEGVQGAPGQDDQLGGSSLRGFRDGNDVIFGDGAADFQLADNGQLLRTVANGAYTAYVEANPTTIVRQANRFDVAGPSSTHGDDYLSGDDGDDYQWGQDGNDELHGGNGNDDMYGELGDDRMFGEADEDAMIGDRGLIVDRRIDGSPGDPASFTVNLTQPPAVSYTAFQTGTLDRRVDLLADGDGDMNGDGNPVEAPGLTVGGNDYLRGGPGHDTMHGAYSDDLMNGDSGGDILYGDDGADVMWGGKGSDDPANPNDRGAGDSYVDYLFGGYGGTNTSANGIVTGGADVLDYRPRPGIDPQSWFEATDTNSSEDHQHHQGIDWIYGGWDRDVLQADVADNGPNQGDRLLDWNGAYNLYTHCNAAYGGFNDVRQHSPAMQNFLQRLAYGTGVGASLNAVQDPTTSAFRELALVYPNDAGDNSARAYPTTPGHFEEPSCLP